jgi:hypothetical protein
MGLHGLLQLSHQEVKSVGWCAQSHTASEIAANAFLVSCLEFAYMQLIRIVLYKIEILQMGGRREYFKHLKSSYVPLESAGTMFFQHNFRKNTETAI